MPIVTLYYDDLEGLTGVKKESIIEQIPMIGSDIERVEKDHIDIEFFPNRPDLYSVEGVARAMRSFMEINLTPKKYTVTPPNANITLAGEIANVRPCIACAVIRNLNFTPHSIESLMNLQESLHLSIGRNRKKASIGVHDLSKIAQPLTYTTVPSDFAFVPLDFDKPMSVHEILEKHPKGVKFAHLLKNTHNYPLIQDANHNVLSFPPIINSELTRVTTGTTELFIEVTGLDSSCVNHALNIVVTALAERDTVVDGVTVNNETSTAVTPDLTCTRRTLQIGEATKLLGIPLLGSDCAHALSRMGFSTTVNGDEISVEIPPYRSDILHTYDLIEDIAIGYGYKNFPAQLPGTATIGASHESSIVKDTLSEIMIGLGYLEVMPFTLTNEMVHFNWMQRTPTDDVVYVENPISRDYTMLRTTLLQGLLKILAANKHHELPQKIFEVGDVVKNNKNALHLALVSIHPKANYTEAKSLVDTIMREQGQHYTVAESDDAAFISHRCADIYVQNKKVGITGEIHPQVIRNFGLENPIIAVEIEI
ncbi:MAG: Phenylalanine--tRNA ligase beta subunit [Candidatus Argoarchaeum ethanivorans]|uniref:Phenylalanine--tRNA ligase beta subunit n=1 Tax=Candidatus Argoarchaeum ethanivorans TaxID=2608793 RepID=A0A811T7R8_9EURY|nr:MAG: Phenylalanine--tRNA ligase beta subunit [Candidatus Argoarchaeum ethanivorans]